MQEQPGVLAHRAGNIQERDDRRLLLARPEIFEIDHRPARLHAGAQGAPDVDEMSAPAGGQPPRAHEIERQRQASDCLLGGGDLGGGHLREVLLLQHLAVGHGQARVDFDFGFIVAPIEPAEQRFLDALRARRRRFGLAERCAWQHRGDQFLDIAALAKKDAKGLIEQNGVLVPLHKYRVQRPIEIVAVADLRHLHGFQRIEHAARADRQAGRAQRPREVEDVFGEAAFGHAIYSAALSSDFTSSSSALTLLPSSRAMSS